MKRCSTCAAWSELIARAIGGGPVEAMCLKPDSPMRVHYTIGRQGCHQHTTDAAFADHPSERAPDAAIATIDAVALGKPVAGATVAPDPVRAELAESLRWARDRFYARADEEGMAAMDEALAKVWA